MTQMDEAFINEAQELIAVTERAMDLLQKICDRPMNAVARAHLGVAMSSMGQATREFRIAFGNLLPSGLEMRPGSKTKGTEGTKT